MTQQLLYCTMYEWASVAQRSATRGDVPESPFPHMDMELSMLACGKPSFTPTLNTTTPAVSLSSASQCSVGLCLGAVGIKGHGLHGTHPAECQRVETVGSNAP